MLFGTLRGAVAQRSLWAPAARMYTPKHVPSVRAYSDSAPAPPEAPEAPAQDGSRVSLDSAVPFTPLPGFEATASASEAVPLRRAKYDRPHRMHIRSSRNNTLITFTTPLGEPLANASGGTVGFKKAGRSGYEAGYRAALSVFQRIGENRSKWSVDSIEMLWNGFGQGREAVFRALMANEGEQVRGLVHVMTDKTPIKIGGVRPKKRRSACLMLTSALDSFLRLALDPSVRLACLGKTGLLALDHARIAVEHTVWLDSTHPWKVHCVSRARCAPHLARLCVRGMRRAHCSCRARRPRPGPMRRRPA